MYRETLNPKFSKMSLKQKTNFQQKKKPQQQLMQNVEKLQPLFMKLAQQTQKLPITFLFGSTGAGKSTLLSYLLQANMTYTNKGKFFLINHKIKNANYPIIGGKDQSCTTVPQIFSCKGEYYIDLPGFQDTRSTNQQIINCLSCSHLFEKNRKTKIIIVVQTSQMNANRGGKFVNAINRLAKIFSCNLKIIKSSTLLVLSKAIIEQWPLEQLRRRIINVMKLNQNISEESKQLLRQILNTDNLTIFPTPNQIKDHIYVIKKKSALMNEAILINKCQISLSSDATYFIKQCKMESDQNIKRIGNQIVNEIKNKFSMQYYMQYQKQYKLKEQIKLCQQYLNLLYNKSLLSRITLDFMKENLKIKEFTCTKFIKNIKENIFYNQLLQKKQKNTDFESGIKSLIKKQIIILCQTMKAQQKQLERLKLQRQQQQELKRQKQRRLQQLQRKQNIRKQRVRLGNYDQYDQNQDNQLQQTQLLLQLFMKLSLLKVLLSSNL